MPAFTKGKWSYADVSTPYEQHFIIGTVDKTGTFYAHASTKTEADAKLITAAPDLYNNVKALIHYIALNDECRVHGEIRELARIIDDIDGKEATGHDTHA